MKQSLYNIPVMIFVLAVVFSCMGKGDVVENGPGIDSIFFDGGSNSQWSDMASDLQCVLSTDNNWLSLDMISNKEYPVIEFSMTWNGSEAVSFQWDKDLGRILWDNNIYLESNNGDSVITSTDLKFKTSNTYPAGDRVTLEKGESVTASMDFTELPGSYLSHMVSKEGVSSLSIKMSVDGNELTLAGPLEITVQ
jgi:hypothetical protein